ncbi:hypothetical protein [Pandoraea apista]|uniref:hypothetical protein n=1 Tax=Pandoraea apista TaxID=93218 RepID=UPI0021AD9D16|nr:hypothetical protein [Pandoraea apista]
MILDEEARAAVWAQIVERHDVSVVVEKHNFAVGPVEQQEIVVDRQFGSMAYQMPVLVGQSVFKHKGLRGKVVVRHIFFDGGA